MAAAIRGYRELALHLREGIERGDYPSGSRLPTEAEMSQMFLMNRHTVRSALKELEQGGYITRIRGKGTFVTLRRIPYAISPASSFTTSIEKLGMAGGCKVLRALEIPAPADVADLLALPQGGRVATLEILRTIEHIPACVTTSYLPADKFPGLAAEAPEMKSLYQLLKRKYDITGIRRAWSEIEAIVPESRDQEILQTPHNLPVLLSRSLVKDSTGEPMEYCISRNRGDAYTLRIDLERLESKQ